MQTESQCVKLKTLTRRFSRSNITISSQYGRTLFFKARQTSPVKPTAAAHTWRTNCNRNNNNRPI